MSSNTFGKHFSITTFGESHGSGIGVVIDGCPANVTIDEEYIQSRLDRRRPGQSRITSPRKESDEIKVLSGVFEGKSTGAPITFWISNQDAKSEDYDHLKNAFRPSHADYAYTAKYGHRDHRGGGRSSARETVARVAAGAVAQLILNQFGISVHSYVHTVGSVSASMDYTKLDLNAIDRFDVRCPDEAVALQMQGVIEQVRDRGDTVGGIIQTVVSGVFPGLGEPVYDKLSARLAYAMFSINAVKGFELGEGFEGSRSFGSVQNDLFLAEGSSHLKTSTNHSGGIQGGISNGMDIWFRTAFKPVATLLQAQVTADPEGNPTTLKGKGRHDPCVLPRAVPIVDAMTALVLVDFLMAKAAADIVS